jgi:large subunit ribosomal protein LX
MMAKFFRVKGAFGEKGRNQVFTMDVMAANKAKATEHIYTNIGSKHKVKRYQVKIDSIDEIAPADSKSLTIRQLGKGA